MTPPIRIHIDRLNGLAPEDELRFTFARTPLTEDEAKDVKMIVNSEQFAAFREFLLRLSCEQYIQGRSHQDWKTHAYNELGNLLVNVVQQLDSYRVKPESKETPDPYEA